MYSTQSFIYIVICSLYTESFISLNIWFNQCDQKNLILSFQDFVIEMFALCVFFCWKYVRFLYTVYTIHTPDICISHALHGSTHHKTQTNILVTHRMWARNFLFHFSIHIVYKSSPTWIKGPSKWAVQIFWNSKSLIYLMIFLQNN